jgi:hypothetical protein
MTDRRREEEGGRMEGLKIDNRARSIVGLMKSLLDWELPTAPSAKSCRPGF